MSEEKNQRLKKYQKNYREAKESQCNNQQNSFLITIQQCMLLFSYAPSIP